MNKTGLKLIFEDWKAPAGVSLLVVEYWPKGAMETHDLWFAEPDLEYPGAGGYKRLFEVGGTPEIRALVHVTDGRFENHLALTMPCTDVFLENVPLLQLREWFHDELTNSLKHALEARPVSPKV
jgi:hypothetical protein